MAHVLAVGVAEGGDEGGFFDADAVAVSDEHADHHDGNAGPVAKSEGEAEESDQAAGIRRMANEAIGAGLDYGLSGLYGDLIGEEAAESAHGVNAEDHAEDHESDADEKYGNAMSGDGCAGELEGEDKVGGDGNPEQGFEDGVGAAVAAAGGGGGFEARAGEFTKDPETVSAEEDYFVGRVGEGNGTHVDERKIVKRIGDWQGKGE